MPLYCDEVIFLQGNLEVVSCPELHGSSNWWVGTSPYLQILKKEYESEPCLRKTSILLTLKHFLSHPPLVCSLSLVPLSANIYLLCNNKSKQKKLWIACCEFFLGESLREFTKAGAENKLMSGLFTDEKNTRWDCESSSWWRSSHTSSPSSSRPRSGSIVVCFIYSHCAPKHQANVPSFTWTQMALGLFKLHLELIKAKCQHLPNTYSRIISACPLFHLPLAC